MGGCQLLVYTAWSPAGDSLGGAAKLTWVNQALLPFRVGDDLVFIHHLDVLILHLIAAGREKAKARPLPSILVRDSEGRPRAQLT